MENENRPGLGMMQQTPAEATLPEDRLDTEMPDSEATVVVQRSEGDKLSPDNTLSNDREQRIINHKWRTGLAGHIVGLILRVIMGMFAVLLVVLYCMFLGPSSSVRDQLTMSLLESSACKFIPYVYLGTERVNEIVERCTITPPAEETDTSLIVIKRDKGGKKGVPGDGTAAPETSEAAAVNPEKTVTVEVMPEETMPVTVMQEETTSVKVVPERTVSVTAVPEETVTIAAVPEEVVSSGVMPEKELPAETELEAAAPEDEQAEMNLTAEDAPQATEPAETITEEPVSEETGTAAELPAETISAQPVPEEIVSGENAEEPIEEYAVEDDDGEWDENGIIIERVTGSTFKGYMMIVDDPSRVFLGVSDDHFRGTGIKLDMFCEKYGAVAAVNASGFRDDFGLGDGGVPYGIVISQGKLLHEDPSVVSAAFDENDILHVGKFTRNDVERLHLRDGAGWGPAFIVNGIPAEIPDTSSGYNPRTVIGQCADGTVLLLTIDGRHAASLGATYADLIDIMVRYGAVNACNMDGGFSTCMYYQGRRVSDTSNMGSARQVPTAFLVKGVGDE